MRRLLLPLLILSWMLAAPARANGLHQCVDARGNPVFTDQPCAAIGAGERRDPAAATPASDTGRLRARVCARSPDELLRDLRIAIAADDVNQIAALYHWPGIDDAESEQILKRLAQIAGRPLESADLLRSGLPPPTFAGTSQAAAPPLAPPTGIAITQTRPEPGAPPLRTAFALVQNVGCWWLRF